MSKLEAINAELRDQINNQNKAFKTEKETLEKDKAQVINLRSRIDKLEYENKELTGKNKMVNEFLEKKSADAETAIRENDTNVRKLKSLEGELDDLKRETANFDDEMKREMDEMRTENDELHELVKTKDRMLDDQNTANQDVKL